MESRQNNICGVRNGAELTGSDGFCMWGLLLDDLHRRMKKKGEGKRRERSLMDGTMEERREWC